MRPGPDRHMCRSASRRMRRLDSISSKSMSVGHAACRPTSIEQPSQPVDLIEVVEHNQPDSALERHAQLVLRLGIAVHHDSLGREAGVQRQVKLTPGGHIAPQALLGKQAQHGGAGERLRSEHHPEVLVTRVATGPYERACTRT